MLINLTGQRFGRLTPLAYVGQSIWRCRCDCGELAYVNSERMRIGKTKSCGCFRREMNRTHGGSAGDKHPLYKTWRNMLDRCYSAKDKRYPQWGGRGILVCNRWRFGDGSITGFECFVQDMGLKPAANLSLDRIKNDGNYEPGNCRWATPREQTLNRRAKTHCKRGHPLTGDNLIQRFDGYRACRTCAQVQQREYEKRRRERARSINSIP